MRKNVDDNKVSTVMVEVFNDLKRYKDRDFTVSEVILGVQGALSMVIMKKATDEGKLGLINKLMELL